MVGELDRFSPRKTTSEGRTRTWRGVSALTWQGVQGATYDITKGSVSQTLKSGVGKKKELDLWRIYLKEETQIKVRTH